MKDRVIGILFTITFPIWYPILYCIASYYYYFAPRPNRFFGTHS